MSKCVPFYVADFIADTWHLSGVERGGYFLLVLHYLNDGELPNDETKLRKLARMTKSEWAKSREALSAFFDDRWTPSLRNFAMRARRAGPGWMLARQQVFERDGFACVYCGDANAALECDHIVPVSRGGSDDLANLATACRPCNRSKKDKLLAEWLQ